MAGDLCPYCGELLTTSLKFCVNCRRSVTEDKIRHAGIARNTQEIETVPGEAKYRLSRKTSYDSMRQFRSFFITTSTLMGIFFVYYFAMKFMLHQPVPFEQELTQFVEKLGQGNSSPQ